MAKRWLALAILVHLAVLPLLRHDPAPLSTTHRAPAPRREPMQVPKSMPNRFRVQPVPGPLQAALDVAQPSARL